MAKGKTRSNSCLRWIEKPSFEKCLGLAKGKEKICKKNSIAAQFCGFDFLNLKMPRGKKKQASVGFCTICKRIVAHFFLNNKRENKEKVSRFKKFCKGCRKKVELKIADEKK